MNRKIILNLAVSLDGYIADENGGFTWIEGDGDSSGNTENPFDFPGFVNSVDTIVMGRKAYDDCGIENIENWENKRFIVATSQKRENTDNVEFVSEDITGYIQGLRAEEGKDIWLFGGAGLTDPFIKADLVDEYIIGIIPIILGKGRPLFLRDNPTLKLHLDECSVQAGIPILVYSRRAE